MPPKVSSAKTAKKGVRRKARIKKAPRFTKEELNEEIDTILTTYNPYMSENCVEFDRKTQTFKPTIDYRKPVVVINYAGVLKRILPEGEKILFLEVKPEEDDDRMRNKFNFRNVATQTMETKPMDQGNQIDPSKFPVLKFMGTASKAEIISAYEKHEKKKKEIDKYSWIKEALRKIKKYVRRKPTQFQDSSQRYLRLCERMVDQNLSEAHLDFSYYDNPSDEFRSGLGSLLPLWNFSCALTKDLPVTGIAWNAHYLDLFAVTFRKLNEKEDYEDEDDLELIREKGCLCVYSLKSPNYPEKIIKNSSALQCLSFHQEWAHLLAAGCDGGTINVFDLRRDRNDAASTSKMTEKIMHHDTVNEVKWLPDVLPQKFCAISNDGKVLTWLFVLNDVFPHDTVAFLDVNDCSGEMPLIAIETESKTSTQDIGTPDIELLFKEMAGLSISANPHEKDLFVVGTEPGVIYKCSFDSKKHLNSYDDHTQSIRSVHWNPYHPRVFLSCSDDMTVRIWDHSLRESVFEFFFENGVKDACWAPFSSTLFAAISGNALLYKDDSDWDPHQRFKKSESEVYVFDLAVNKREAIGNYTLYSDKENISLTTVCFHPSKPVLMVGDERGLVTSFKLSPNLRSSLHALETLEESKFVEAEVAKMEKLLAPARGRAKRGK